MPGQISSPSDSAVSRFSRSSCLTPRSRWPAARSSPTVRGRLFAAVTTPRYDGSANTAPPPVFLAKTRPGNRVDCPALAEVVVRLAHGDGGLLVTLFPGDGAVLERRLVGAVGFLHLISGRITQLALRSLDVIPRVADLAPHEVDGTAVLVDQDSTVVLLVDAGVVEGVLLVVVGSAQIFLLLVGEGVPLGQDRSLHRVLSAVLTGDLGRGRCSRTRRRLHGSR